MEINSKFFDFNYQEHIFLVCFLTGLITFCMIIYSSKFIISYFLWIFNIYFYFYFKNVWDKADSGDVFLNFFNTIYLIKPFSLCEKLIIIDEILAKYRMLDKNLFSLDQKIAILSDERFRNLPKDIFLKNLDTFIKKNYVPQTDWEQAMDLLAETKVILLNLYSSFEKDFYELVEAYPLFFHPDVIAIEIYLLTICVIYFQPSFLHYVNPINYIYQSESQVRINSINLNNIQNNVQNLTEQIDIIERKLIIIQNWLSRGPSFMPSHTINASPAEIVAIIEYFQELSIRLTT